MTFFLQPPKKRRRQGFKEEPYYFLSDKIPELEKLNQEDKKASEESEDKIAPTSKNENPTENENPAENDSAALEDLRIWKDISSFFGIRKDIPEISHSNFMTRSKENKSRNLYITNSLVRNIIDCNHDRVKVSFFYASSYLDKIMIFFFFFFFFFWLINCCSFLCFSRTIILFFKECDPCTIERIDMNSTKIMLMGVFISNALQFY